MITKYYWLVLAMLYLGLAILTYRARKDFLGIASKFNFYKVTKEGDKAWIGSFKKEQEGILIGLGSFMSSFLDKILIVDIMGFCLAAIAAVMSVL